MVWRIRGGWGVVEREKKKGRMGGSRERKEKGKDGVGGGAFAESVNFYESETKKKLDACPNFILDMLLTNWTNVRKLYANEF